MKTPPVIYEFVKLLLRHFLCVLQPEKFSLANKNGSSQFNGISGNVDFTSSFFMPLYPYFFDSQTLSDCTQQYFEVKLKPRETKFRVKELYGGFAGERLAAALSIQYRQMQTNLLQVMKSKRRNTSQFASFNFSTAYSQEWAVHLAPLALQLKGSSFRIVLLSIIASPALICHKVSLLYVSAGKYIVKRMIKAIIKAKEAIWYF